MGEKSHSGRWLGIRHGRLILSVFLGIVVGVLAWRLLIVKFGPSSSPLSVKNSRKAVVQWPDGRGTVGVASALPPEVLLNQSYVFDAHVSFFGVGPAPTLENSDYDTFISAHLSSAAFDIKPTSSESQLAKGGLMSWGWMVLPKQAGRQVLLLTMDVEHKSKHAGAQLLSTKPLWSTGPKLVQVEEPWLKRGQIDILSIVVGVLSSLVTSLWEKWFPKKKAD